MMPPPVPPGLAPMNIRLIISSSPASEMVSIESGTVLNPAVRVVTDWNSTTWSFCHHSSGVTMPSMAKCSVNSKPRAPSSTRAAVALSTRVV